MPILSGQPRLARHQPSMEGVTSLAGLLGFFLMFFFLFAHSRSPAWERGCKCADIMGFQAGAWEPAENQDNPRGVKVGWNSLPRIAPKNL